MTERLEHKGYDVADGTRPAAAAAVAPMVSVIIPCHNQARFLADAIESVLAQQYGPVEIIVVNDGSTDDTAAVAARYPAVRHIVQDNRGLAEARNTGFVHSRGSLLVFLDADDRLLPHALARGAALLDADPSVGFAAGHSRFIASDGSPLPTGQPARPAGDGYVSLLRRNSIRNPAMVMFRRAAIERVGGFDRRVAACADYEMYLRISSQFPVRFYAEVIAEYRKHDHNMSLDAALMLRHVRRVLRKQRWLLTTADRREAFDEGARNIGRYYGDRLAKQIRRRLRAGSGRHLAILDIATLIWCHPRGAVEHTLRKLGAQRRRRLNALARPS